MKVSKKQNSFSEFSPQFRHSTSSFNDLNKKIILIAYVFPKLRTVNNWLDKCLKSVD